MCGKKYKIDIKYIISGVIEKDMREWKVDGLIPNNRVAREKCRDLGWIEVG
jgi:hypothetical protein